MKNPQRAGDLDIMRASGRGRRMRGRESADYRSGRQVRSARDVCEQLRRKRERERERERERGGRVEQGGWRES